MTGAPFVEKTAQRSSIKAIHDAVDAKKIGETSLVVESPAADHGARGWVAAGEIGLVQI
jgi:hypothetical protein